MHRALNTIIGRAKIKPQRQSLAVATQSFTPQGDLQATDRSNLIIQLIYIHIKSVVLHVGIWKRVLIVY